MFTNDVFDRVVVCTNIMTNDDTAARMMRSALPWVCCDGFCFVQADKDACTDALPCGIAEAGVEIGIMKHRVAMFAMLAFVCIRT